MDFIFITLDENGKPVEVRLKGEPGEPAPQPEPRLTQEEMIQRFARRKALYVAYSPSAN